MTDGNQPENQQENTLSVEYDEDYLDYLEDLYDFLAEYDIEVIRS